MCRSEELYNFLTTVKQQCCYLTETIQDVMGRLPSHPSKVGAYKHGQNYKCSSLQSVVVC